MEDTAALSAPPSYVDDDMGISVDHHPGPSQYVRVAIVLALITAVEVVVYYLDLPALAMVVILVGLASVKFSLVAAYFMHLKFDARLLRRVFITGIILACCVFAVALFTMKLLFS